MRKALFVLAVSLFMPGGLHSQQMGLNEVVTRAARYVEEALPQRTMVAVLDFASSSETLLDYLIEELTGELVAGQKVIVADRNVLALAGQEMSGDIGDESMKSLGRMLGVQFIVSGTLTNMETFHRFRIRIVNAENAVIQTQISFDLRHDAQVAVILSSRSAAALSVLRTANARPNWISGELALIGVGARYERMLGSRISLGLSLFFNEIAYGEEYYGVDAFLRFYPWGRTFFMSAALGFHNYYAYYGYYDIYGLGVTMEIGWKFDVGKVGGFFIQPGIATHFMPGEDFLRSGRLYFGMGYAF
jgi:TolB-like protein